MKRLSRYIEALRLGAALDQKNPANGDLVVVPLYELVRDGQRALAVGSWGVNHTVFVNDSLSGVFQLVGVTATFHVASTSLTLQVEVCNGTTGITGGTNQLSSAIPLSGSVDTPQNGTLIASPTLIQAGGRINLIFSGTNTGLSACEVCLVLKRIV